MAVSQEESVEITQAEVLPEATVVFAGSPAAAARGEAPLKSHPKDKKDNQGSVPAQQCQSWAQERCFGESGWPETIWGIWEDV